MTDDRRQRPDRREGIRGGRRTEDQVAFAHLIAARLKLAMRRHHLYRCNLADLAGVSEGTLRNVLAGRDTTLSTLQRLASVLQIPLPELMQPEGTTPTT